MTTARWSDSRWTATDCENGLVRLVRDRDLDVLRRAGDVVWVPATDLD